MEFNFRSDELERLKGWYTMCFAKGKIRETEREAHLAAKISFMIVELIEQELERRGYNHDGNIEGDDGD